MQLPPKCMVLTCCCCCPVVAHSLPAAQHAAIILCLPFVLLRPQGSYEPVHDPPGGPTYSQQLKQLVKVMMTVDPHK